MIKLKRNKRFNLFGFKHIYQQFKITRSHGDLFCTFQTWNIIEKRKKSSEMYIHLQSIDRMDCGHAAFIFVLMIGEKINIFIRITHQTVGG